MNEWYVDSGGGELYAGPPSNPDRYTLEEIVSQGMEGRLWRSWLPVDGHRFQVAVKEIHQRNVASIDEWFERWERQAELLRSLDHPGLIRVREVFQGDPAHHPGSATGQDRSLFLVMNWAAGRPFDAWSRAHDHSERLAVLARIAEAVDHLHSGSDTSGVAVLHRDIKPQNIIIDSDGRPRLVDFGFARLADGTDYTIVGSANYMAPEIPLGAVPTPASDRYSFGCVAYSVLSGHRVDPADQPGIRRTIDALRSQCLTHVQADHLQALLSPQSAERPGDLRVWSARREAGPGDGGVPGAQPGATVMRPAGWWPSGTDPVDTSGAGSGSRITSVHRSSTDPPGTHGAPSVGSPPTLPSTTSSTYPPSGSASWPPAQLTSFDPRVPSLDPVRGAPATLPPQAFGAAPRSWAIPVGIGLAVAAILVGIVAAVVWLAGPTSRHPTASSTTSTTRPTSSVATAPPVVLTNLVGQGGADAQALLKGQGLRSSVEYVESPEPAEKVLSMQPVAGTGVASASVVHLTLSSPTFTMPDLRNRTLDAAQAALQNAGHIPSYVSVQPVGAPASSLVIGQEPEAGVAQPKDKPVVLKAFVTSPTTTAPVVTPVPPDTTPTLPPPTAPPTMP